MIGKSDGCCADGWKTLRWLGNRCKVIGLRKMEVRVREKTRSKYQKYFISTTYYTTYSLSKCNTFVSIIEKGSRSRRNIGGEDVA